MQAYYRMVRDSYAVLPAFASDIYYTKKSSSSVAAAVVCGTPLIADLKLLNAYPYLTKVCFFQHPSAINAAMLLSSCSAAEVDCVHKQVSAAMPCPLETRRKCMNRQFLH